MASVGVALVPVEEYLRTMYHPDCEWVDGEVKERNVGEGSHAVIQKFLAMFFGLREEEWNVIAAIEQRVQTSATHYRIPDVCLLRGDAPFEEIVRVAPLLCVEILSPEDRMSEMYEKIDDYLAMGVASVWVIDPRRRKILETDEAGKLQMRDEELTVAGTPVRLRSEELFRQLNKLQGRAAPASNEKA